ncbi:hypothetical protein DPMN_016935 [Dreissena polymorpha]|uniref:Uncharacterized protein n=1 Tax=Dreissena polymorpha TaxID=45954 RepID=A0A9D4NC77_DREPO|nr:hypothetical protein DPMN_016935 [Dreissena polymorpha]
MILFYGRHCLKKPLKWQAPLMLNLHFHTQDDSRTALMHRLLPHSTTGGSICIYHLRTIYLQSFNNVRLLQGNKRYAIKYLLPDRVQDLNDQRTNAIVSAAKADFEVNLETFHIKNFISKFCCEQTQIPSTPSLETTLLYRKTCIGMLLGASTCCLRCQYHLLQQNARSVP